MFQEMENGEMQVEIKTQLNLETFQEWRLTLAETYLFLKEIITKLKE